MQLSMWVWEWAFKHWLEGTQVTLAALKAQIWLQGSVLLYMKNYKTKK